MPECSSVRAPAQAAPADLSRLAPACSRSDLGSSIQKATPTRIHRDDVEVAEGSQAHCFMGLYRRGRGGQKSGTRSAARPREGRGT